VNIGQSKDPIQRFKQPMRNPNKRMAADVATYKAVEQHFSVEILSECDTEVEADVVEERMVMQYRAR
jgi:hypothetical protein